MYIYATILNGCLQCDLYISLLRSPKSGCFVAMRRTWCCQCPEATPGTYHGLPWTCPEVEGVFSCLYHCIRVLVFKNMSTSTELQLCFLAWKLGAVNPGSKQVFVWQCSKTYSKGINGHQSVQLRFRRYRMKSKRRGKHNAAKQLSVQYTWRGWSLCEGTAHIRCTNSNEGGRTHRDMEVLHMFCWGHLLKDSIILCIVCHNSDPSFCNRLFNLFLSCFFQICKYVQVTS